MTAAIHRLQLHRKLSPAQKNASTTSATQRTDQAHFTVSSPEWSAQRATQDPTLRYHAKISGSAALHPGYEIARHFHPSE